ncbi:hypothetical protein AB205_0188450 [Aquarana catesbeiana]|uniref:Uncharacterized protein n=1 Tax=Aquarana catesbeiana TaxID=8400 RepID=A0A2G9RBA0_AQUCT|nr:hypothetical protein AB205_0188450 [Aquarana catesbeiana]
MQLLCLSIAATVPSNAATVPIKRSHCAHQIQPLCPSSAATVPIKRSHCAHQAQPLVPINYCYCAPSNAASVPINCRYCVPSNAASVPINCRYCAPSNAASMHRPALTCLAAGQRRCPARSSMSSSVLSIRRPITAPDLLANQVTGNRPEHLID